MHKYCIHNELWPQREMESSVQKDKPRKDKKYVTLYFLFSSCFSAQRWGIVIFNMSKAISPLLDHFWVPICIENPFVEYGILFTFVFLRFTYTIWFLKASNLDFITLNTINLAKKPFSLVFYQYLISFFDAVWVDW